MRNPLGDYKKPFWIQKSNAKKRGIGWNLTFKQWVEWWGDDIDNRGVGHNNLQMQRIADSGPYEIGNIRKGRPRDNAKTANLVRANRAAVKARRDHEGYLNALMWGASKESPVPTGCEHVPSIMSANGSAQLPVFRRDR